MVDLATVQAVPLVAFDPATLTGLFAPVNAPGFPSDIKILKMFNGGTVGVDISLDGVTLHDYWPAGATLIIDFQTNHSDSSSYGAGTLSLRQGQIIWARTGTNTAFVKISGFR